MAIEMLLGRAPPAYKTCVSVVYFDSGMPSTGIMIGSQTVAIVVVMLDARCNVVIDEVPVCAVGGSARCHVEVPD